MSNSSIPLPRRQAASRSERQSPAWPGSLLKRLFDLAISGLGMLLLAPVYLYLVLRIKRTSPGPAIYRGPRAGKDGKIFQILKFRTMYERPESYDGPRVTAEDDPRITPLGKWLRDTKLNELPQLWNVFVGQMSLVGPRPEDPEIVDTWPQEARREILSVRPGITSPASVLYRDEETMLRSSQVMQIYLDDIVPSKLRLDQLYVRYHTFWGDLDILIWTVLVLLPRVRQYNPPEERLLIGPMSRLMQRHINRFAIDVIATFVAMTLTGLFWRSMGPLDIGLRTAIALATGFAMLFSLTNVLLGANRIHWSKAAATDVLDLVPGTLLATGIAFLFNYFYPTGWIAFLYGAGNTGAANPDWFARPLLPPVMLLMASVLALVGFVVSRYRSRLITGLATRWVVWRGSASAAKERILIVGGGNTGQFAAWMLNNGQYSDSFHIIGFVDDDLYKQEARIRGVEVLGRRADIVDLVSKHDIGIIIFAIHNISGAERQDVLELCAQTAASVFLFPDIPAALDGMARSAHIKNGDEASTPPRVETISSDRLCPLCMTNISPMNIDKWLEDIELSAESGDLESAQRQIQELRRFIRGDTITQPVENIMSEVD
ncbi:sugar transferase [Chloroflexota bacterium]